MGVSGSIDEVASERSHLRCQFFDRLSQGIFFPDVTGKDDIGETGMKGLIADGPDRNAGEDLAKNLGLFHAKGTGGDIRGGHTSLRDDKRGAFFDSPDNVDKSL